MLRPRILMLLNPASSGGTLSPAGCSVSANLPSVSALSRRRKALHAFCRICLPGEIDWGRGCSVALILTKKQIRSNRPIFAVLFSVEHRGYIFLRVFPPEVKKREALQGIPESISTPTWLIRSPVFSFSGKAETLLAESPSRRRHSEVGEASRNALCGHACQSCLPAQVPEKKQCRRA